MTTLPAPALDPAELLLVLDTATTTAVVALGTRSGALVAAEAWSVGHRHAEELLGRVDELLGRVGLGRQDVAQFAGVGVGTGPGAFTGLRVGVATAKALARAFGLPLAGVPSGSALLAAASASGAIGPQVAHAVLLLPAGPADAYLVLPDGSASLVPGGDPELSGLVPDGAVIVAMDLPGRAPADALARGDAARAGFPAALVERVAARIAAGLADDPALLVPEYVTLPRGARAGGEVAWSPARP